MHHFSCAATSFLVLISHRSIAAFCILPPSLNTRSPTLLLSETPIFPRSSSSSTPNRIIEYQSDHGRGTDHLSYLLEDGDVVAYQSGTWSVDGVEVGDGTPPVLNYCCVGDHSQIVFTHNLEHGVVRGWRVLPSSKDDGNHLFFTEEDVEFGPEQLVARLPVEWDNERVKATCLQPLHTRLME